MTNEIEDLRAAFNPIATIELDPLFAGDPQIALTVLQGAAILHYAFSGGYDEEGMVPMPVPHQTEDGYIEVLRAVELDHEDTEEDASASDVQAENDTDEEDEVAYLGIEILSRVKLDEGRTLAFGFNLTAQIVDAMNSQMSKRIIKGGKSACIEAVAGQTCKFVMKPV
ncbi:MAG: hypothetical protein KGQ41_03100 [Alphaproteobacteria bacterium]|nr:hypothetical protein [Alphaproteobacteria bacterium]